MQWGICGPVRASQRETGIRISTFALGIALLAVSVMAQEAKVPAVPTPAATVVDGIPAVPVDPLPMPLKLMPQIMRLLDALYRYVLSAGSGANSW
jgi:hypothetical protein